jgi:hypothetical protein
VHGARGHPSEAEGEAVDDASLFLPVRSIYTVGSIAARAFVETKGEEAMLFLLWLAGISYILAVFFEAGWYAWAY